MWSETNDHSGVVVSTERSADPASRLTDCDGNFEGYGVPLETRITSDDGLIRGGPLGFSLRLDRQAQVTSLKEQSFTLDLDFEQLKAAGETPDRWISGFSPKLTLILVPPEMNPQDAEIVVDEPTSSTSSRSVTIGSLTFP
ncbi:MAG: hypothetical protein ABI488_15820 [Polyangiaceae bacterium]